MYNFIYIQIEFNTCSFHDVDEPTLGIQFWLQDVLPLFDSDSTVTVGIDSCHELLPLGVKQLDLETFETVFDLTESQDVILILDVKHREHLQWSETSFCEFRNNWLERIGSLSDLVVVRDVCRL